MMKRLYFLARHVQVLLELLICMWYVFLSNRYEFQQVMDFKCRTISHLRLGLDRLIYDSYVLLSYAQMLVLIEAFSFSSYSLSVLKVFGFIT